MIRKKQRIRVGNKFITHEKIFTKVPPGTPDAVMAQTGMGKKKTKKKIFRLHNKEKHVDLTDK
jgi:hypothetical protein